MVSMKGLKRGWGEDCPWRQKTGEKKVADRFKKEKEKKGIWKEGGQVMKATYRRNLKSKYLKASESQSKSLCALYQGSAQNMWHYEPWRQRVGEIKNSGAGWNSVRSS